MYIIEIFWPWVGEFAMQALDKLPVPLASALGIYYSAKLAFRNHDRGEWRKRRRDQLDQNCEKALSIIHHIYDSSLALGMAFQRHYEQHHDEGAENMPPQYAPFSEFAELKQYAIKNSYFDDSKEFNLHYEELNLVHDRLRLMRLNEAAKGIKKYRDLYHQYFKQNREKLSYSQAVDLSNMLDKEGERLVSTLANCIVPDEER